MRIVNSLVEDFGGFELDAGAVELHSEKPQDIMLPYRGALPGRMSSASSAYLQVNVQPTQGAQLVLVVNKGTGKVRRPLEATNEEIIDLLDRFFEQKNTGLEADRPGLSAAIENGMGAADGRAYLHLPSPAGVSLSGASKKSFNDFVIYY